MKKAFFFFCDLNYFVAIIERWPTPVGIFIVLRLFSKMVSIWDAGLSLGFPGCPWPPSSAPVFQGAGIVGVCPNSQFPRFLFKTVYYVKLHEYCWILYEARDSFAPCFLKRDEMTDLCTWCYPPTTMALSPSFQRLWVAPLGPALTCESYFRLSLSESAFCEVVKAILTPTTQQWLFSAERVTNSRTFSSQSWLLWGRELWASPWRKMSLWLRPGGDWGFRAYGCRCLDVSAHTQLLIGLTTKSNYLNVCTVIRYTLYWHVLTVPSWDRVPPIGSYYEIRRAVPTSLDWCEE